MMHKENIKIYIVDDEKDNLNILKDFLCDYQITIESDSVKALKHLKEIEIDDYDIFIFDIIMGDVSGLDLLDYIKNSKLKDKSVIMQTAKSLKEDIVHGLKSGANRYITKPYDMEVLECLLLSEIESIDKMTIIEEEIDKVKNYAFESIIKEKSKVKLDIQTYKIINEFLLKSLEVDSYDKLIETLMGNIKKFKFDSSKDNDEDDENAYLRCTVLFQEKDIIVTDRGEASTMDKMILSKAIASDDIIQKGSYTALSSKHKKLAILIRNTPKDMHESKKAIYSLNILLDSFEQFLKYFKEIS